MSKCVKCGHEILTGDIHWEMGLCNNCYNELYKDHKTHISLDKMWLKLAQSFRDENEKLQDKVADLEAKLAEKDKRIKKLNLEAQKYYEDAYCNDFHNQDKISFAVEQLEKVKEFFLEEHRDEEMDTDYIITKDAGEIADYLLDQIKQLKEGQDV